MRESRTIEPFRLIDWGCDGFVTIETSVGHLSKPQRTALLEALNAFALELNGEIIGNTGGKPV